MDKEKTYHINNYVVGMDNGFGDRKCLTISEIKDGKIYVKGTLYDECAEIVGTIFQKLKQEENQLKEVREKLNTQLAFTSSYQLNYQSAMSIIEEAKQILDKENKQ